MEPKKEDIDEKAEVTKTEDEAPDHDKENEVKSEAVNEISEIKTETKAESVDKSAEEKMETATVNGETAAESKDAADDSKSIQVKEVTNPKTEQVDGGSFYFSLCTFDKAYVHTAHSRERTAAEIYATLT